MLRVSEGSAQTNIFRARAQTVPEGEGVVTLPAVHLEVSSASAAAIEYVESHGGTVTCAHFNRLALRSLVSIELAFTAMGCLAYAVVCLGFMLAGLARARDSRAPRGVMQCTALVKVFVAHFAPH